jgi:dienelactone hydrolase
MRPSLRGVATSFALVLIASCGGGAGGNEVPVPTPPTQPPVINPAAAPAWDAAVVFLPNTSNRTNVVSLAGQRAAPVAIAMHGCSGLGSLPNLGPLLASLGYIVIMPDSLARPDRANRFTCSGTSVATANLDIFDKRVEEVEFTIAQVRGKAWFDGRHLLLLGHSEGGYAVAQKAYAGITAAAISGYWCTVGLPVAQVAPTLTVNYDQDPYYFNKPGFGVPICAGGLAGSRHLVLRGALHTAFENEPGRSELAAFATTQASR